MTKIIVCRVGGKPTVDTVEESPWKVAKAMLADDYDRDPTLQIVYLEDGVELTCLEDGEGQPFNRAVPDRARERPPGFTAANDIGRTPEMAQPGERGVHYLRGHFLLARHDDDRDEPMSLTDADIAKWLLLLALPG